MLVGLEDGAFTVVAVAAAVDVLELEFVGAVGRGTREFLMDKVLPGLES